MENSKPNDALDFLDTALEVAKVIAGVLLIWGVTACVLSLELA